MLTLGIALVLTFALYAIIEAIFDRNRPMRHRLTPEEDALSRDLLADDFRMKLRRH
jgi:hypothetical protein